MIAYTAPVPKFVALGVVHLQHTCPGPLPPIDSSTSPPPGTGTIIVLQFLSWMMIPPLARLGYSTVPVLRVLRLVCLADAKKIITGHVFSHMLVQVLVHYVIVHIRLSHIIILYESQTLECFPLRYCIWAGRRSVNGFIPELSTSTA